MVAAGNWPCCVGSRLLACTYIIEVNIVICCWWVVDEVNCAFSCIEFCWIIRNVWLCLWAFKCDLNERLLIGFLVLLPTKPTYTKPFLLKPNVNTYPTLFTITFTKATYRKFTINVFTPLLTTNNFCSTYSYQNYLCTQ